MGKGGSFTFSSSVDNMKVVCVCWLVYSKGISSVFSTNIRETLRSLEKTYTYFFCIVGELDQSLLRASSVFIRFFNMVNNNKIQNKPSVLRASIFALDHTLSQFYSSYVAKILVEKFYCFCYKISERPTGCRAQYRPGTIWKIKGP